MRLLLLSVFFLISLGQKAHSAEVDPCKAASTKTAYEAALPVSPLLKKRIDFYREKWRALCDKAGKKPRPSLADLYALAAEISTDFTKTALTPMSGQGADEAKADKISDLVSDKYPSFVPAFEGSFIEYEYFRPVQSAFTAKSELGTAEDKTFWVGYLKLRGTSLLSPWYEQTWDYGGCLRFGEFDWVKEMETLETLKKTIKSVAYAELITELEQSFIEPFDRAVSISAFCACKQKDAVLVDLKKLAKYFAGPGSATTLATKLKPLVNNLVTGLEAKKIVVSSQAEAHCSGG